MSAPPRNVLLQRLFSNRRHSYSCPVVLNPEIPTVAENLFAQAVSTPHTSLAPPRTCDTQPYKFLDICIHIPVPVVESLLYAFNFQAKHVVLHDANHPTVVPQGIDARKQSHKKILDSETQGTQRLGSLGNIEAFLMLSKPR